MEVTSDKNVNSKGFEARLSKVIVNDIETPLENLQIVKNEWIVQNDLLFGDAYSGTKTLEFILPKASNIEFIFVEHAWSGIIKITNNSFEKVVDLYNQDGDEISIQVPPLIASYSLSVSIFLFLGALCLYLSLIHISAVHTCCKYC